MLKSLLPASRYFSCHDISKFTHMENATCGSTRRHFSMPRRVVGIYDRADILEGFKKSGE